MLLGTFFFKQQNGEFSPPKNSLLSLCAMNLEKQLYAQDL
jgi:hypothetical protein